MNTLTVLGAALGAALALLATSLTPRQLTAAQALYAIRRPPPPPQPTPARLRRALATPLQHLGLPTARVRADLAVLDRDPATFLAHQTGATLLGLLTPAAAAAALGLGGVTIGWSTPGWLGLLLAAAVYTLTAARVRTAAAERRRQARYTLAALLDIIPPALAAGTGIGQALTDASHIASGWAADQIRHALHTARLTHQPAADALADLGHRIDVAELTQLAASLHLAGEEGTRIRHALTARGEALATRLTTDMQAHAEAATERMSLPLMALAGIFLLALVFPALASLQP